jgi:hypothetical protein
LQVARRPQQCGRCPALFCGAPRSWPPCVTLQCCLGALSLPFLPSNLVFFSGLKHLGRSLTMHFALRAGSPAAPWIVAFCGLASLPPLKPFAVEPGGQPRAPRSQGGAAAERGPPPVHLGAFTSGFACAAPEPPGRLLAPSTVPSTGCHFQESIVWTAPWMGCTEARGQPQQGVGAGPLLSAVSPHSTLARSPRALHSPPLHCLGTHLLCTTCPYSQSLSLTKHFGMM